MIMLIATHLQPVITARIASEKPAHDVSALAVNLIIVVVAAKSMWEGDLREMMCDGYDKGDSSRQVYRNW